MVNKEIRNKCEEIIHKILPSYGPIPFGMGGIDHIDNNRKYKDSNYFYTKSKKLIHYTSIESMLSILKSKKIRMFCLNGMDDEKELSLAMIYTTGKVNEFDEFSLKKNHFAFSLCEYEIEEKKQSLNLWKEYGSSGKGCGIVFEIENSFIEQWENFRLSNIYYEIEKLNNLKSAYDEFSNFPTEIGRFEKIFTTIFSFHKTPIYDYEKEVRLLYLERDSPDTFNKPIYLHFKNGKKTSFVELDLEFIDNQIKKAEDNPEKGELILKLKGVEPSIKIKKIILGYKLSDKNKHEISRVISDYFQNFQNKSVSIENSTLIEYFNHYCPR